MPLDINGKQYLTTAEAAQQLGVTQGRIRQLIQAEVITDVIKFSNRSLVSAAQVESYDQQRKEKRISLDE